MRKAPTDMHIPKALLPSDPPTFPPSYLPPTLPLSHNHKHTHVCTWRTNWRHVIWCVQWYDRELNGSLGCPSQLGIQTIHLLLPFLLNLLGDQLWGWERGGRGGRRSGFSLDQMVQMCIIAESRSNDCHCSHTTDKWEVYVGSQVSNSCWQDLGQMVLLT